MKAQDILRIIPLKLQGQNRWVVWVKGERGKPRIYQPSEHWVKEAYPGDPYTWDSCEEAVKALLHNPVFSQAFAERQAGLGFVNSKVTPLVTITLHGALMPGPKVAPWALPYFDTLDAYAEEGITPGSVVFLWEGPKEPFSKAGTVVAQPPYILLTLRKVAGTPSRVGTAKTRYEKFLELVDKAAERYADKLLGRFSDKPPQVAEALVRLVDHGLRWRGEGRAIARCPYCKSPKPTLAIAVEDKMYFRCERGCTPQDIVGALKLEWSDEAFSPRPASDPPRLKPVEDAGIYLFVEEAYTALFTSSELPQCLRDYGVSHDLASSLFMGLTPEGVVLPFLQDEEGKKVLYGYALISEGGEVRREVPEEGFSWASPGFRDASGLVAVHRPLLGVGLWGILSRDPKRPWGVVYTRSGASLASLVRQSKAEEVYLWPETALAAVSEWRGALRNLPVRVRVVPPTLVPFTARAEAVKAVQEALKQSEVLL